MTTPNARQTPPERPFGNLGDEKIADAFANAFTKTMTMHGIHITESEVEKVERTADRKSTISMRLTGYAGDITSNQFCDPKTKKIIDGAERIGVGVEGYTPAFFRFVRSQNLSGNEFSAIYKQE